MAAGVLRPRRTRQQRGASFDIDSERSAPAATSERQVLSSGIIAAFDPMLETCALPPRHAHLYVTAVAAPGRWSRCQRGVQGTTGLNAASATHAFAYHTLWWGAVHIDQTSSARSTGDRRDEYHERGEHARPIQFPCATVQFQVKVEAVAPTRASQKQCLVESHRTGASI